MVTALLAAVASLLAVFSLVSGSSSMATGLVWRADLPYPLTTNVTCTTEGCKGFARDGQLITWPECPCKICHREFLLMESQRTVKQYQSQMIEHYDGILNEKFAKSRLQAAALRSLISPVPSQPAQAPRSSSRGPRQPQQHQQQQPIIHPRNPVTAGQLRAAAQNNAN